ncbi:MAG: caspase-like domain-containing protein [Hyphomicrobiales bacterium]|nr:caspase-like domain-containing protein [Hyphomicrobiales bacterium]
MRRSLLLAGTFLGLMGLAAGGQAQTAGPPPTRVALVVGESHYAAGALPTTLNDAGLIASTLTAAGYSVVGLPDLGGDDLRKALSDFVNRANAAGPQGSAVLYFAGEAVQYAGENYLVPVDATIPNDVSVPLQGIKLSDYTRALAALPIQTRIVIVDGARPNGFARSGTPLAGGLAPVKADPGELIAFNDAPGTVAQDTPGATYSPYATALNAAMNQPGLPVADVFSTLRLQVNTQTRGAQIPYDSDALRTQFSFFAPAPGTPPTALLAPQIAARRARPIHSFTVDDAYQEAIERDTFAGYEQFLRAYPHSALAARVRNILAARREALTWERVYDADTPNAYWTYLQRYPDGLHAQDARRRLRYLDAALEPPPSYVPFVYDVPPPPPDEYVYVDRPVVVFDEPQFAPPPPPAIAFAAALGAVFLLRPPHPPHDFDRHDLPVPQPMLSPFALRVAPAAPPPHPVFPTLQATPAQIGRMQPAAVAPAVVTPALLVKPPQPQALVAKPGLKPVVAPRLAAPAVAPHPATAPVAPKPPGALVKPPAAPLKPLATPLKPLATPVAPVAPKLPVQPKAPLAPKVLMAPKLPVPPKPALAPKPLAKPALPAPAKAFVAPKPALAPKAPPPRPAALPPRPALRPAPPPHPVVHMAPPPHPVVRRPPPPRPVVHAPPPPRPVVHRAPPPRPVVHAPPPPRPVVHMAPPPRPVMRPPPRPAPPKGPCGRPGLPACH